MIKPLKPINDSNPTKPITANPLLNRNNNLTMNLKSHWINGKPKNPMVDNSTIIHNITLPL